MADARSGAGARLSPEIMAALERLYGRRRPIPFQTLNFMRGTEQPLHADSVHFDSQPSGWMCGVWVALEEIGATQGPLVVLPGSHRVAPGTFAAMRADGGERFDMAAYERALDSDCAALRTEEFHASVGDAVVWHADLAHGGAPVLDPASTRWSQVTHYFFDGFTYVTPMLGDRDRGEVYLREPLVDISTGRAVPHRVDGRPVRLVRRRRRPGPARRAGRVPRHRLGRGWRLVSRCGAAMATRRRVAGWRTCRRRGRVADQRAQSETAVARPRANLRYPSSST